jgi:hypothetical protein
MSGSKEMEGGGSGDSGLPRVLRVDYGLQGTVFYRVVRVPAQCLPRSNLRRSVVNVNVCAWRVMGALGYWVMVWVKEWSAGIGMSLRDSQHYPQSHVFGS